MRERTRTWTSRLLWGVLLVTGSVLAGVRLGRPLYYTDGEREVAGSELGAAGMLAWGSPEVACELPGPVQGRVAELPDGRLVYGRTTDDGTTDLVVFDPRRPRVPPEPAYGLNTPYNELAPALGPDGRVWFASDRPGGVGGYDLYTAAWRGDGFGDVRPVPVCNTALDETDPAPAPRGGVVFARVDPQVRGGDDGVLFAADPVAGTEPRPVFPELARRSGRSTVDRDPAFSPDGAALWFLRREDSGAARICRASVRLGEFAAPEIVGRDWGTGALRGPLPGADGLRVSLLQPRRGEETAALWYHSVAHELQPWWPGQRWLEQLLAGTVAGCLLVLVLLHYGRRWSTLDLVAQCLLLSMLVHLLVFLWLMGVEVLGSPAGLPDGGSDVQVGVVVASAAGGERGADGQLVASDVPVPSLAVASRDLAAAAPGAAVEVAAAVEPGELASAAGPAPEAPASGATPAPAAAALADAAAEAPRRAGADAARDVRAAALPELSADARAAEAARTAAREAAAAGGFVVTAPAVALVGGAPGADPAAVAPPVGERAAPAARELPAPAAAALADAPLVAVGTGPRAGAAEPATAPAPAAPSLAAAAAAPVAPGAAPAPSSVARAADPAAPLAADGVLAAPGTGVERSSGEVLAAAPAPPAATAPPTPRAGPRAGAVALRDAAGPTPAVAPAGAPKPSAVAHPHPDPAPAPLRPASVDLAGPVATAATGAAVPQVARAGVPPTASPAPLAAPAAELPQGASAAPVAAAPPAAPAPGPDRTRAAARGPVALRDAPAVAPPAASPVPVPAPRAGVPAAAARSAVVPAATLAGPAAPFAPPVPQRPARFGAAVAVERLAAPGSLLERAAAAPGAAAPRAAEPLASTPYSNRFGPAKAKALEQFGGSAETERAVAAGLRYLAKIQNRDGSWGDAERFDDKYGSVWVGKSALCVLAFLGAGHTPASGSEHSEVVRRALARLLAEQDRETGAFGPSSCYGHGIATYALAECYGLTRDPALQHPLEHALEWILRHQGPRRDKKNRGGWGYFSPGLQPEDDYARVSVSSWMVMALESARLSGVELPEEVLPRAKEFLELAFDAENGWFRYNHKPSRVNSAWPTLPASTPAAAFCLQLLGAKAADERVAAAVGYTVERRPEAYRRYGDEEFVLRGQGNVYFWYYGTLCCFLAGGDAWTQWNERLRTVLPKAQEKDGSFPPIDTYAREAGDTKADRSYTTAMCVLSLEVYYRYFTPLLLGR